VAVIQLLKCWVELQMTGIDNMGLTKIHLEKNNRMLRAGFGRNNGKWFARIDLWFIGIRMAA
jgi:hypothetical protein